MIETQTRLRVPFLDATGPSIQCLELWGHSSPWTVLMAYLQESLPVWLRGRPWVTESTSDKAGDLGGT